MNKICLLPCVFGCYGISEKKKVACIISKSGKIKIFANKNKKYNKAFNLFLLRGLFYFFYNFYHLILGIVSIEGVYNKENSKFFEKTKNSLNISYQNIFLFIILILGVFFSYFLLGVIPIKLSFYLSPKNFNIFFKRVIIGLVKCTIIYLALICLKLVSKFKQFYKFNMAIFEKEKEMGKVNFLLYLVCSTFLTVVALSLFGLPASLWYSVFINLLIAIFVFSVNNELFLLFGSKKIFNIVTYPFYFLITEKSSQKEIKCVNIVLKELELGGGAMELDALNVAFSEAYVSAKQKLEQKGVYEKSDLDFIFCEVLNKNRAELRLVKTILKDDYNKVMLAVEKRCGGMPVTKIFGHANFYGLDFVVTKDVLSPRMDTEVLVEQVLKNCTNKTRVLDIGTGSGAIAITIAKLGRCKVIAVDISEKALKVAKENAKNNKVDIDFKISDLFSGLGKLSRFDIIVSNPPYIPSKDIQELDKEVKDHDPILALDGGPSGLEFYERIINELPKFLTKNGKIFFEVGINQAKDVKKLLQNSFKDITIVKDLNKIDRVVYATIK